MLERIVSGGQTGVDQAALRAAKALGVTTGGWAPQGWKTEDGPAPWLADYGLREYPAGGYPARTKANVRESDGTLILVGRASELSGGTLLTLKDCQRRGKPCAVVDLSSAESRAQALAEFTRVFSGCKVLNVAGPREGKSPGVGALAEAFLAELLSALKGAGT